MTTHASTYSAEELRLLPQYLPDHVATIDGQVVPLESREDLAMQVRRYPSCFPAEVVALVTGVPAPAPGSARYPNTKF